MIDQPLVTITIPTYNSEKTLTECLESIRNQTYKNIQVIIVDSYSRDGTIKIAKSFGIEVIQTKWKLLGARYIGFDESNGDIIFFIDSDQILERTVVERAVNMLSKGCDILCLEEYTHDPKTWLQKLFDSDRKLIHKFADIHLDPIEGVLLARVYRREILDNAFKNIPEILFPTVIAHDHAIIYYEAYNISTKIEMLPNAVWHIEPGSLWSLIKKNYRYGESTYYIINSGYYRDLLKRKVRFRKAALKDWKLGLQTYFLLALKGSGYYLGYFSMRIRESIKNKNKG